MTVAAIWLQAALTLLFCGVFFSSAGAAFVGINIGTGVSNIPSPVSIVAILRAHQISHVRLFDADARMLTALSNTGIEVMVSIRNDELVTIGASPSSAAAWITRNVAAYSPTTNITAISVGSDVLSVIPNASVFLLPAMNNLYRALVASNMNHVVKVSTPLSIDIIPQPFPPSTATFNTSWNTTMFQILQFLRNTDSFYMLNAYPYYEYIKSNGIFPLDYALFRQLPLVNQIVDPNTLFHYGNMFEALVDAAYCSIAALNFSSIPVVVTETGWPWFGGLNEPDATTANAVIYNNNLIRRVLNGTGPPSKPSIPINTYIYELFNEDERPGPVSEKNWGVFFSNGSTVYDIRMGLSGSPDVNASSMFCIAMPGGDARSLQDGLNWACGQGQADCSAIQLGQPCYLPNTLQSHASYAYNNYYQRMQNSGGTCDFDGTATLTSNDPSYGSCRFTGSTNSSREGILPSPAPGPSGPSSGSSAKLITFGALLRRLVPVVLLHMNVRIFRA